jgi:hypothetical protein
MKLTNPNHIAILAHLAVAKQGLTFKEIKTKTSLTDGNLASCNRSLEHENMIKVSKGFVGKHPYTLLTITRKGMNALIDYADWFNRLIEDFEAIDSKIEVES